MALTKITSSVVAVNSLTVANIADNAVDATKIASNSILTRHIDDDQITTDQIAANTIATANIADNAVDGTKIASNSILTRHIDDNQIGIDQLNVSDGSSGQALTTDGSGTLSFASAGETNRLPLAGGTLTGNLTMGGMILKPSGDGGSIGFNRNPNDGSHVGDSAKRRFQINGPDDTGGDFLQIQSYNSSGTHQGNVNIQDGNVGIGESSPDTQLHITSDTAGVNAVLTIKNAQNNRESMIQLLDESNGGGLVLDYDNGGNAAYIKNNVNGALSIYLGGTGTANELNDYEEGTFTPLFYGSSSGTANNDSLGYYTKIGRVVTLHVDVYNKAFGTYSGDLRMQLPFTNAGTSIPSSAGDIYFYPSGNWDGVSNFAGIGLRCYNTSYLNFNLIQLDSDRQTYIGSSNTSTSNSSGNFLRFSFTYVTTT